MGSEGNDDILEWVVGAGIGAIRGARVGAAAGPWGAAVGAAGGALIGGASSKGAAHGKASPDLEKQLARIATLLERSLVSKTNAQESIDGDGGEDEVDEDGVTPFWNTGRRE